MRVNDSFSAFWLKFLLLALGLGSLTLLSACSINVKKEPNGQDKQVDIKTLVGGIHVSNEASASDVGVAVYPGARLKQKQSDGDDKSANVNISGFGYGLKVVALEYESQDSPAKLLAFYKDQLKRFGSVLECRNSGHFQVNMNMPKHGESHDLTCDDTHGDNVELKVGSKENQHIVSIEPEGKGSSFALVYVHAHGKEAEI